MPYRGVVSGRYPVVLDKRLLGATLLGFLVSALVLAWLKPFQEKPRYNLSKVVRYGFQVQNNTVESVENSTFRVFAPVKQNSYQRTIEITANHPFEIELDEFGNQALVFKLDRLSPLSSQIVNITVSLQLANGPQVLARFDEKPFLLAEPNIEVDSPIVKSLAEKLGSTTSDEINSIASWVNKNITDIGYVSEDRGALYAITDKKGDCTEFSSAFVALARASEIPSRMIGGFVLEHSGKLHAENYHNWSEFLRDEAWHIADPQNNIVDSGYGSYIAFYNFNKHSRMKNSHRFLSYDPRLSVQML